MRNGYGPMGAFVRAGACALVMLGVASPAVAQFGGLKKKVKAAAGQEAAAEGAKQAGVSDAPGANAAAGKAGGGGESVVLTPAVVDQMIAGLKAQQAYRESAKKDDTPYGRHSRAVQAYKDAQVKCDEAKQDYVHRLTTDEKLQKKQEELSNKMSAAMDKGDNKTAQVYQRQMIELMSPSCLVESPTQPDDYWDSERQMEAKAAEAGQKGSGLSPAEYPMAQERVMMILRDPPPPDASDAEKNAVKAKSKELKTLLGWESPEPARAEKAAPAQPAPPPPQNPGMSDAQMDMSRCMAANAQKHEEEIKALGERAQAAQQAGDIQTTMAIADSINQLQMAGCNKNR